MKTFDLKIVTPTQVFEEPDVTYLRCPGMDGLFGVMARHTRSIFALDIGEIKVTRDKRDFYFATRGGYTEVMGDSVLVLAETAEKADYIDRERAEASLNRAKERLVKRGKEIEIQRAEASMARAINRLTISRK